MNACVRHLLPPLSLLSRPIARTTVPPPRVTLGLTIAVILALVVPGVLKVSQGDRTLFYVTPRADAFEATVVLAIDTSRSMLSPPNKTAIFNSRSLAKSPRIVLERFGAIRVQVARSGRYILSLAEELSAEGDMRAFKRLTLVSLVACAIVSGSSNASLTASPTRRT